MPTTPHPPQRHDVAPVAVIGAGPSGLATAAVLGRADVPAVVLESADRIGASWRARYDHLRLHTPRGMSRLPGLALPRQAGSWVARDDFVRYLERYVIHHRLDVRTGTRVRRIEPVPAGDRRRSGTSSLAGRGARWLVQTDQGPLRARAVVVATGRCHTPHLPDWPGRATFPGTLLHSAAYRSPEPYRDGSILVVGAGNSGTEICLDLVQHGAKRVWLAVRTPPNILPRSSSRWQKLGRLTDRLPVAWRDQGALLTQRLTWPDLTRHGLGQPPTGPFSRNARDESNPVLDHGFVDAVRAGNVQPVAAMDHFDGPRVVLADDTRLTPDTVIAATGYRPNLESLVGHLDVLDATGRPTGHGAHTSPKAPHLYFAGYTNPLSGLLHEAGVEARAITRAIRRERTGTATVPAPRSEADIRKATFESPHP